MSRIYAIQTGQTVWDAESRLRSPAGAPLTDQGAMSVQDAARELTGREIKAVYACTLCEGQRQTAELVAKALGVKVHEKRELHELDYGLWQGLTTDEIKRRQPKAFRQWTKAPASTRPPGGETLSEAQNRLRSVLKGIIKRTKKGSPLLVLGPVLMGLLKCFSEKQALDAIWQNVDPSFSWGCYEVDGQTL